MNGVVLVKVRDSHLKMTVAVVEVLTIAQFGKQ
jgi:hypothetical protein